MSEQPGQPQPQPEPRRGVDEVLRRRFERRRARLSGEIRRSREGEHRVPTWVMVVVLVAIVAGWLYLIFSS
jgi:hypothetical protein